MTLDLLQTFANPSPSVYSLVLVRRDIGSSSVLSMKSAAEYRAYAEQCIESAKTAHSLARDALLEMAHVWIDAAHQLDQLRVVQRTTKPEPR